MSPELSIIKLFLCYNTWENYKDRLAVKDLPKEIQPVYSILDNYHSTNEAKADLTIADAANLIAAASLKDKEYYLGVVEQLQKLEVTDGTTLKLINRIIANKQLEKLSLAAYDAKEGRVDVEQVLEGLEALREHVHGPESEEEDSTPYVSDDLEFILNEVYKKPGLRWRLKTLNKMLGSLRPGDFGFIFARPETGKTTLLASELTYMAEQADGDIIWLANEEDGKKVMLRVYQATFGVDLVQLNANPQKWKDLFKQKYGDRLRVIQDPAVMNKNSIERIVKKRKPRLLVIDQLSKITGFSNDRKDLELGAACEWGRTLAKQGLSVVAVHQADGTAEGVKWLTMNHVSNAKTAMQAEADWILGVGKVHDAGWDNIRFLHASKNKLQGDADTDHTMRHGKVEVIINAPIARYEDVPNV